MAGWDEFFTLATASIEFIFPFDLWSSNANTLMNSYYSYYICGKLSFGLLQQLCVANTDSAIRQKLVCGLMARSPLKHSWKLLDLIPGAHILQGEEQLILTSRKDRGTPMTVYRINGSEYFCGILLLWHWSSLAQAAWGSSHGGKSDRRLLPQPEAPKRPSHQSLRVNVLKLTIILGWRQM